MMTRHPPKRRYWLLNADPRQYHWDTLFVKGKEMWRGAGAKPAALRQLKQVHRGDRVVCYHGAPDRQVYALATVASDPYPDPLDPDRKLRVVDLKALQRLPRPVPLKEIKLNRVLRRMKFLKDVRATITPVTDEDYQEILRMAGIVAAPGLPLP